MNYEFKDGPESSGERPGLFSRPKGGWIMNEQSFFQLSQDAVTSLAERYGTPLLVLSLEQVEKNYEILRNHIPQLKIHYAMKANPDLRILDLLINVRLGAAHLRALECDDRLVDLERHAGGPHRRNARLDIPQHARLHGLPHRLETGAEGTGLHAARRRVAHHRILVHDRGVLVAVAHPGQRLLARHPPGAVVRINL